MAEPQCKARRGSEWRESNSSHTPTSLKRYLNHDPNPQPGTGRVFILEGLNPEYIAVLGGHFKMHPSMFVDHERTVVISPFTRQSSDFLTLPGTARTAQHFTLKYFELIRLPEDALGLRMYCAETGRHIALTRMKGDLMDVGVVRRKCTIWNRSARDGGWDYLVLTDPPLRTITTSQNLGYSGVTPIYTPRKTVPISPQPFQGGYLDFMPHSIQMATRHGPPRTSMLDDLCFYLQTHAAQVTHEHSNPSPTVPNAATIFAKKIIAAHYLQLYNFTRSVTSEVQFHMSRLDRLGMDYFGTAFIASGQWSDAQALERRIGEYSADLESICSACGIPLDDKPDVAGCAAAAALSHMNSPLAPVPPWYDCTADFQVLRLRFAEVRHRAELLNAAITGLASISGNQKALREAKSTKALTLMGLVFIPLAYTATLFSMTESFGPGGDKFWVYFVVSVPLIFCVLGAYTALDRYGDGLGGLRIIRNKKVQGGEGSSKMWGESFGVI
ncbi:hypothetical protein B0T14DRAFT_439473 [Immersiella caudata]|uniref:Uncharacterized protein n=1 Tax=Immersiella caudata TaxID=314043 RepID=A0AA39T239_9PEZI|nr:hypothetical protein B0T14DRAFT_439473 [Immersiella caudata]